MINSKATQHVDQLGHWPDHIEDEATKGGRNYIATWTKERGVTNT